MKNEFVATYPPVSIIQHSASPHSAPSSSQPLPLLTQDTRLFLFMQGNYMAATEDQLAKMGKEEHDKRLQASYDKLSRAGAHYVIDSVNDLPTVIEDINRRLSQGEKP